MGPWPEWGLKHQDVRDLDMDSTARRVCLEQVSNDEGERVDSGSITDAPEKDSHGVT